MEKKVRLNCYVIPDIKKYLEEQSDAYGMSLSAYLTMIIQTYRQQSDSISMMNSLLLELKKQNNDL